MAAGKFKNANTNNALFVLYQAILNNEVCSYIVLSDKVSQFYANKYDKKGEKEIQNSSKSLMKLELNSGLQGETIRKQTGKWKSGLIL